MEDIKTNMEDIKTYQKGARYIVYFGNREELERVEVIRTRMGDVRFSRDGMKGWWGCTVGCFKEYIDQGTSTVKKRYKKGSVHNVRFEKIGFMAVRITGIENEDISFIEVKDRFEKGRSAGKEMSVNVFTFHKAVKRAKPL